MAEVKGKIPPQALDLEEAVLGAALQFQQACDDMFEVFNTETVLYKEAHQEIYKAIKQLYHSNSPVDLLTVSEVLTSNKKLDLIGGDYYLISLTQKNSSGAHQEYHCRILVQKYIAREVIRLSNTFIEMAYNETTDAFDLLDAVGSGFDSVNDMITKGHTSLTWADAVDSIPKRVEFLTHNQGKITGLPTGLNATDKHFSGWQKSDFIVIGADSGMGKTAYVLNNMIAVAKANKPVGMFSMEMSVIQLAIRGVATESEYHLNQLMRHGFEKPKYFAGLQSVVNEVRNYPIYIDDRPALTVQEMKRKARQLKRKHNIELLVIDFVQMFSGDKDIRINVSEAARECKNIAKELDIPVIGLSQLSREVRKANFKIPSKHHLKESSAIEEAADVIMLLYRPEYYGYDRISNPDLYELLGLKDNDNACGIVAKNRNGSLGNVGMHFVENKTKYVNPEDAYLYKKESVESDIAF